MSIYKKLLAIQKELKGLSKDKKSFNYDYVTGNKLLGFIKPIMNEQGLILKQEVTKVETERVQYKTSKGAEKDEVLYKVWQKFTWVDIETGDKDENEFFSSGMNEFEKGLGSALTYAERYFLLKYFHIATDEDDIDNADRKAHEEKEEKARLEKEEKEKLALLEKQKADELALKGKLVHDLNELMGDNTDMFEKSIIKMNKTFKTEYKGFGEFSNVQLQQYINYLNKQKNKDLENMVNRVDEREEK